MFSSYIAIVVGEDSDGNIVYIKRLWCNILNITSFIYVGDIMNEVIEIESYDGSTLGYIDVDMNDEVKVSGKLSLADVDENIRVQLEKELSPFMSLNYESCVNPLEQELASYEALKKHFLDKNYYDCGILIKYYFGHIDYGVEFGYFKSHAEICLILQTDISTWESTPCAYTLRCS